MLIIFKYNLINVFKSFYLDLNRLDFLIMNFEEFVQAFIFVNYYYNKKLTFLNKNGNQKNKQKKTRFPINSVPLGIKKLIFL